MNATWHLDDGLIDRYIGFALTPATNASVESHLQACPSCQARLAASDAVTPLAERIERTWERTADRIDRPRRSWLETVALAARVPDHLARVLGASTAFRGAWVTSLLVAIAAAVAIDRGQLPPVPFLLLSPLLPVLGVAAAYAGGEHGAGARALEVATPFGEIRLLLLRTSAVTTASVVVLAVASLLLPGLGAGAVSWLLPALALTAATLALSTRFPAEHAAGLVAAGWLVLLGLLALEMPQHLRPTGTDLGSLAAPVQLIALAVLVLSSVTFLARRQHLDLPVR